VQGIRPGPPAEGRGGVSDYDTDILQWSERQADALRRRAANEIDWDNVAEEIEDMGNNVVRAVASHLVQAMLHDLKAEAWPLSREVSHWRAEARGHRDDAREAYAPSMADRRELKIERLYQRALRRMPETIDEVAPLPVPEAPSFTLAELLALEAADSGDEEGSN
jgi:hypothetical protein